MAFSFKVTRGKRGFVPQSKDFLNPILRQEAERLRAMMLDTIVSQGRPPGSWPPITQATAAGRVAMKKPGLRRHGTKALLASGTMLRSIMVEQGPGRAFVGIPRGKSKEVFLAGVHEFGAKIAITVTRKMLAFIHAALVPAMRKYGSSSKAEALRQRGYIRSGSSGFRSSGGKLRVGGLLNVVIPKRSFIKQAFDAWRNGLPMAIARNFAMHGFERR